MRVGREIVFTIQGATEAPREQESRE